MSREKLTGQIVLGIIFCFMTSTLFAQGDIAKVYWGNQSNVYRSNADGSNATPILTFPNQQVRDVVIGGEPFTARKVYCLTTTNLYRANFDGSGLQPLLNQGGNYLAIDVLDETLYFSNDTQIFRVNLDGSGLTTIYTPSQNSTSITGLAVDVPYSKLYFLESRYGGFPPSTSWRINQIDLHNSQLSLLTGLYSGGIVSLFSYRGLEVYPDQLIYISSYTPTATTRTHSILSRRIDLKGDADLLFQESVDISAPVPNDMVIDFFSGKIYWSSFASNNGSIRAIQLDGSGFQTINNSMAGLKGVSVYSPSRIVESYPASGTIDARQPSSIDGSIQFGIDEIQLSFLGEVDYIPAEEFSVVQEGGLTQAPNVAGVSPFNNELTIHLTHPISVGAWTSIIHNPSETFIRIGYLPADVNGDGSSTPTDILALIDSLNGVTIRPHESTDINRSGIAEPSDILRVIDLLNGAGAFEVWNGASLP